MLCADGWRERWVESTYKGSEQGAWGWTAGKFYGDAEKDKGNVAYLITSIIASMEYILYYIIYYFVDYIITVWLVV